MPFRQLVSIIVVLSFCILFPLLGQAQARVPSYPTPTAYSFLKFQETPVDHYSGVPDISVMLHALTDGSVQLPFRLRNHASGIKVEEQASWVGLGWNLQTAGMITQMVNGENDIGGSISTISKDPAVYIPLFNVTPTGDEYFGTPFRLGTHDSYPFFGASTGVFMPDMFSYNMGPYAGKFIIDKTNGAYRLIDKNSNLLITRYPDPNSTLYGNGWRIKTPDGMIYIFEEVEFVDNVNDAGVPLSINYHLTRTIFPDGSEIKYFYDEATLPAKMLQPYNELLYMTEYEPTGGPNYPFTESILEFTVAEKRSYANQGLYLAKTLSKIETKNVVVDFYTSSREDIVNDRKLDRIIIKDRNNSTISREINFYYSYFSSSALGAQLFSGVTANELSKRLKLDSVKVGTDPAYAFSYYEDNLLPTKCSASRDHWGYSNGMNNQGLLPNLSMFEAAEVQRIASTSRNVPSGLRHKRSADRGANLLYIKSATLKTLTYPTGGVTTYNFEPHSFSNFKIPPAGYAQIREQYDVQATRNGATPAGGTPTMFTPVDINGSATVYLDVLIVAEKGYVPTHLSNPTEEQIKAARFTALQNCTVNLVKYDKVTNSYLGIAKTWSFPASNFYYGFDGIPGITGLKIEEEVALPRNYKYGLSISLSYPYSTTDTYANAMHVDAKLSRTVYEPFHGPNSIGGGLRIKSITHDPNDGNIVTQEFEYGSEALSSGKLVAPPGYIDMRRLWAPDGGCSTNSSDYSGEFMWVYDNETEEWTNRFVPAFTCVNDGPPPDGYDDITGRPCFESPPCYFSSIPMFFHVWTYTGNSNIGVPFLNRGGTVNYDKVTIYNGAKSNHEGYIVKYFRNLDHTYVYKKAPIVPHLENGLLDKVETFNKNGEIVRLESNEYEGIKALPYWGAVGFDDYCGPNGLKISMMQTLEHNIDLRFTATFYNIKSEQWRKIGTVITDFKTAESVVSQQISYNSVGQPSVITEYTGNFLLGPHTEVQRTQIWYPFDLKATKPFAQSMVFENVLEKPLRQSVFRGVKEVVRTETDFASTTLQLSLSSGTRTAFLKTVDREYNRDMVTYRQTAFTYSSGKVTEVISQDGVRIAYLWDFTKGYLIAQAKNSTYASLKAKFDACPGSEECFRNSLGSKVQLTTFINEPLVGITRITDTNGLDANFIYDNQWRLKFITDNNDWITQYFSYHFTSR